MRQNATARMARTKWRDRRPRAAALAMSPGRCGKVNRMSGFDIAVSLVNVGLTVVLVVAALVTVKFARDAGRDSAKAAGAAEATVSAVRDLLVVAQGTAEAGQQTVEALASIRAADAHDRRLRRLRNIASLVGQINWKARYTVLDSRLSEQSELAGLLGGLEDELPECKALAGEGQPNHVLGAGLRALAEITAVLKRSHESG
jgi:hypothetical protein